jgi:hypothetical protein
LAIGTSPRTTFDDDRTFEIRDSRVIGSSDWSGAQRSGIRLVSGAVMLDGRDITGTPISFDGRHVHRHRRRSRVGSSR